MEPFKILIVDNDEVYRGSLRRLFGRNYEIREADNAADAHAILRNEIIHLALVDIRLTNDLDPNDVSGLTLCDEIDPLVGRLVMTAFTDDWHVVRTALDPAKRSQRHGGADGFYSKEWDKIEVLLEEVRRILKEKFEIMPQQRIAVLTSGGEAPGMNAAIWSVVRTAMNKNVEVVGIQEGYRGLIEDRTFKLNWNHVSAIMADGGTILQSARLPEFIEPHVREKAVNNILKKQISGLIVIGGDGSMRGAKALANDLQAVGRDLRTVAIPGTIDNDIWGSDMSLGAASAANSMVELVRNMIAPARALKRVFIVEVMGACCGYLAIEAAIGTGSDAVVIPETIVVATEPAVESQDWKSCIDASTTVTNAKKVVSEIADQLRRAFDLGKRYGFIILAEGVDLSTRPTIASQQLETEFLNGSYLKILLEQEIRSWNSDNKPDVRVQSLGYPVRGVRPCSFDVWLGAALGEAAVRFLIEENKSNIMVGWSEENGIVTTDFEDVITKSNVAPSAIWKKRPKWRERLRMHQALSQPPTDLNSNRLFELTISP